MKRSCFTWVAVVCMVIMCAPAAALAEDDAAFTLNMERTELSALIRTVSEKTGTNFIVDPRVSGQVTVVSTRPLDRSALYAVFESILAVHGYSAVEDGNVVRIVPSSGSVREAVPVIAQDGTGDRVVTRVIRVDHAEADDLVSLLRPLLPENGRIDAHGDSNQLIITAGESHIRRAREIIARVDRPVERAIEIVNLEHASARDVVELVDSLNDSALSAAIVADNRTNNILLRGDEETRVTIRSLIADLDTPMEQAGNTRVHYLRHAEAEGLVDILASVGTHNGAESVNGAVSIQADTTVNALIITAPPDRMREIDSVIRQLDVRRPQVLVEAIIVELTADGARELGVQFFADGRSSDDPVALTSFGGSGTNIVQLAASPQSIGTGLSLGAVSGDADFGGLLRALASDADNNILSTPSLVTLDNQEAEIVVGQNVPFVTGRFTGADVGTSDMRSPFQTIERQDVGLSLRVKPQINDGNTVRMQIEQEVSSISGQASAADIITNKRALSTTVLVEDGQTLVLGGLIDDTVRTRQERVPLLGSIPILGHLFRYETSSQVKQNLMVFLHPRVLDDAATADQHSRARYQFMRDAQIEHAGRQGLMEPESAILPKLDLPDIEMIQE